MNVHENYLQLMREYYGGDACLLDKTVKCYDEQMERKLNLDLSVKLWLEKSESGRVGIEGNRCVVSENVSKDGRSVVSRSSSRLSSVSQKREKLALAQLNLHRLKLKQLLDEEERPIRTKKELLKAEMEAEKAAVSLKIYEDDLNERKTDIDEDLLPYLCLSSSQVPSQESAAQTSETSLEQRTQSSLSVTNPAIKSTSHSLPPLPSFTPSSFPKCSWGGTAVIEQSRDSVSTSQTSFINVANGTSCKPTQTVTSQCVKESWTPNWKSPLAHTLQSAQHQPTETQQNDNGLELVKALKQVVVMPKVEYQHFDGDPLKYVTFFHNFETYLEKDNPDDSRRLQFLIQHCTGKARDAIESCSNLPASEGYRVAKEKLRENIGKPHIIAGAHIRKLFNLPNLKNADGASLLEFGRQLDTADRTLTGMGIEYVADLNHMNTLRELVKKLPMFLRAKWTEGAGKIIDSGRRPKFQDFARFIKERAKLVDNEFGQDMKSVFAIETNMRKKKVNSDGTSPQLQTFANSLNSRGRSGTLNAQVVCLVCLRQHEVWKCELFKGLPHEDKRKVVQRGGLCNKCLAKGHIAKDCPKLNFKCQHSGCGGGHHTSMHRNPVRTERGTSNESNVSSKIIIVLT